MQPLIRCFSNQITNTLGNKKLVKYGLSDMEKLIVLHPTNNVSINLLKHLKKVIKTQNFSGEKKKNSLINVKN